MTAIENERRYSSRGRSAIIPALASLPADVQDVVVRKLGAPRSRHEPPLDEAACFTFISESDSKKLTAGNLKSAFLFHAKNS